MGDRNITIKDVARMAKVSKSTVSRVVNNQGGVKSETEKAVWEAVRRLGYKPNIAAQRLVRGENGPGPTQEPNSVALLLSSDAHFYGVHFFSELINATTNILSEKGLHFYILKINREQDPELIIRRLTEVNTLGVLKMSLAAPEREFVEGVLAREFPVVVVDHLASELEVNCVCPDYYHGAYEMTRYLIGLGHQRIGVIAGPKGEIEGSFGANALRGYQRALEDAGLDFDEGIIVHGDYRAVGGHDAMMKLIQMDERPTAVFVLGDEVAVGAIQAVAKSGLSIPDDISIAGFDDLEISEDLHPALTTVHVPKKELGNIAVNRLIAISRGDDDLPLKIILPTRVVVRDSCRALDQRGRGSSERESVSAMA
ncbi:MAG: LacI family DNA-binding transcriptional regulator [Firmicutes bacterium]|nr:LacI family DNA-binding transcriptional regulator [Bacillota bacterium]